MQAQWIEVNDHSLGKVTPSAQSSLYSTVYQAKCFAVAVGYSSFVLQEGKPCLFYRGKGSELYKSRRPEKGCKVVINIAHDGGGEVDNWEIVEEEIDSQMASRLYKGQDEASKVWQESRRQEQRLSEITNCFWETNLPPPSLLSMHTVVIYEHQRWFPIAGWKPPPFPTDAYHYSTPDAHYSPPPKDLSPPPSTQWCGAWCIDSSVGDIDDGWEYSLDFKWSYHAKCGVTDMVRRRKWRRDYIPLTDEGEES
eukprot:TRINITY_DN1357_c0_g3_i1.p1 TRINITY_DN1357_c0_g3~~TRINITY_DN1357_c0_g3_i1.p1  ORF type:complete len:252 (+),score=60.21 TRINITY_DN1357_c0_g3_i1:51-806(+)